ncbi:MAG: hypothetical protein U0575_16245 [Phycisphaerales bacterium]
MPHAGIHLLCPLAVEARGLRGLGDSVHGPIVVGPLEGPAKWLAAHAASLAPRADGRAPTVVLAGVAGGLRERPLAGEALIVDEVFDEAGASWRSPIVLPGDRTGAPSRGAVVAVSAVAGPSAKRALAARHARACVVDMESAEFAAAAQELGVPWLVVRGVSDGVDHDLPDEIMSWIAPDGSTRAGAVAAALLRRPSLVPTAIQFGRRTAAAMRSVRAILRALLPLLDARPPA